MDEKRFSSQLFLISPQVIGLIADKNKIDEAKATDMFWMSELYAQLEDEPTKQYDITDYVLSCYEALHTTSTNYIIEDIDLFIEAREEANDEKNIYEDLRG